MTNRVRTTRRLEVWLKDTSVAMFVLNAHRRLVFFNSGCERLTGWPPAELLGQVCEYVTEADTSSTAALRASLTPPSDVWRGSTVVTPTRVARRDMDPLECLVHFYPLTNSEQVVQASLGIIQLATEARAIDSLPIAERLHHELAELRRSLRQDIGNGNLIGRCPAMRRALGQSKLAGKSSLPIFFQGESGTGRKFMARSVHHSGEQSHRSFVPLDCRSLPADFLESTLLRMTESHRDDAFGIGTVYLDRIDELPRDLQRIVLKLIESKSLTSPRMMAASHLPLEPLVESKGFLSELLFGMTAITISVPALRGRTEDLEPLAQFFLEELNRGDARQVCGFHADVLDQFRRYHWPGNVAELRTVVTEARSDCPGTLIESAHLPFRFRTGVTGQSIGPPQRKRSEPLDPLLLKVEREQIELALLESRQNKAKAAELLGITRPRLYRRMEVLGIVDDDADAAEG